MKKHLLNISLVTAIFFSFAIFVNTFAKTPLVSTTVVISQAYGGGGGTTGTYMNDYVELKNISSSPQSLDGLSLVYGSATGQFASSATNAFVLPTGVTLSPGQYYLVQLSNAGMGGTTFPVPADATTTNLSMSGTNGKVALVTSAFVNNTCGATATPCTLPDASIIDLVSWGTASNAEGGAATNGGAALTSTQGNVRKTNGCTETDNNNADFDIVTAPVPRNTSSSASSCSAIAPTQHVVDFNGDGKTDFAVTRDAASGLGGQRTWFINLNGPGTTSGSAWGLGGDVNVPVDYDGDQKTDIAVWRQISTGQPSGNAFFYILNSATNTVTIDDFGQVGDNPTVVGDYDGDGKADVAVYRSGLTAGQQSTWYYRGSLTPANITFVPWGQNGDFVAPGDYDGDGKNDFVIQRGPTPAKFWRNQTTAGIDVVEFGLSTDPVVPGDYDGDGKTDIAIVRGVGAALNWWYRKSSDGSAVQTVFGITNDFPTQGDYDGDGKTDQAIWRNGEFWYNGSTSGVGALQFGANGDDPVANYNTH